MPANPLVSYFHFFFSSRSTGTDPRAQITDFSLEDVVQQTHWVQDWAFEESRTSLEVLQRLQGDSPLEPGSVEFEPRGSTVDLEDDSMDLEDGSMDLEDHHMDLEDNSVDLEDHPMQVQGELTLPAHHLLDSPSQEHPGTLQQSTSRQAARRRRLRKNRPPVLSKKDNLTRARIHKASKISLPTLAEVSNLKPGLKFQDGKTKVYTLGELQKKGFQVVPWDGRSVSFFFSISKSS